MWRSSLAALAMSLAAATVHADESSIRLAQAEGVERVQAACVSCHSLDYIVMNSPFQDRAGWEKTVTKMVKVMGAPIAPEDVAVIVDYLEKHYGKVAATAAARQLAAGFVSRAATPACSSPRRPAARRTGPRRAA